MHALDKIRQKRRFEMFNQRSKDKVLELNAFFGKYIMHYQDKIKKVFTYYDTPNKDLEKSNIVLYKTQIGNFVELNMATEKINSTYRYTLRTNYKHFTKSIKPHDSIMKHKDFLIDNFSNMFMSSINFDPEFLLRKLQVAYTIKTTSTEYRSINAQGLKITYSFDKDKYLNHFNNLTIESNLLTIYQHSNENTDEEFNNLVDKLIRYCKELTPIKDTKIMIARRLTATKPEKKRTLTLEEELKQNQTKNKKKKK